MAEIKEMVFSEETKIDHVKAPWEDELKPGDFVSYAPSYVGGEHRVKFDKCLYPCDSTGDITYYLFNPLKHGAKADGKYPLLIWIHGFNCADGINAVTHSGGEQYASPAYQEAMGGGAFVLVPIANEKWVNGKMEGDWSEKYFEPLATIIRNVQEKYFDNISKTLISGGSSGGWMSWIMAEKYTELFDICMPIASGYIPAKEELTRMAEAGLVTLVMHGKRDELCSFDENIVPRMDDLKNMKHCTLYFPEWVKNGDGGVASLNFGFEMGQHCLINQAQANLMYSDGTPYDERFPEGLTGWIKEVCNENKKGQQ